jgi:RNA polymerase sigma-54 factor
MNIRQQLNVRLGQNLVMTQSLQQAIKLLQLSKLEMENLIQNELIENPVLEEIANESEFSAEEKKDHEPVTTEVSTENGSMAEIDTDYYFQDYIEYQSKKVTREIIELPSFENTLAQQTSLSDHLQWQLKFTLFSEEELRVGEAIIGNLNEDGYLRAENEEIASMIGCEEETVEEVRNAIQSFDPTGVASRSLKESLLVQLKSLEVESGLSEILIQDHLLALQLHDYDSITEALGCTQREVHDALELVRTLDPKPGAKFNEPKADYIEPDVFIVREKDGFAIVLNEENMPKLQISSSYQAMLKNKTNKESETNDYLRERINSAKWLLKSFVQRQQTIYKVVASIVERQLEFFDKGLNFLKPMVLSDIAEDIEMHESTVSRVVTNKYAHTPRGVFELKYFFSSSIKTANGDDVSSLSVKRKIKQIIEIENSMKPLSDSKIMALLIEDGLNIARRTVAKYREEMNIPPSKLRKAII